MMKKDKSEALYASYIKDVIARNQKAIDYQKSRQDYWQDKPRAEVEQALQKIIEQDNTYRKDNSSEKNPGNDLETLIKTAPAEILYREYHDNEKVAEAYKSYQETIKNLDGENFKTIRQAFTVKMGVLYKQIVPVEKQEELLNDRSLRG